MSSTPEPTPADVPELVRIRLEKRADLLAAGVDPYPRGFERSGTIAEVRAAHPDLAPDSHTGETVRIAGRVMLSRTGGKLCFATIRDESGEIQVMVSLDGVGADALEAWKKYVDLGDHIGVVGEVITSKRGELSVLAAEWRITSKGLRPLPDKHHGLNDPEARVRQRYVDLIVNEDTRRVARQRSAMVRSLRDTLHGQGYLEVETPMLQQIHGGAAARPFKTHINAYDLDLYLRIAPELYLKRLAVGGMEKVFEINRNFRNEGADSTHNPEFTMLEAYQAYGNYETIARLMQDMIQDAAVAVFGGTVVERDGQEYDLGGDWKWLPIYGAVSDALGVGIAPDTPLDVLQKHADGAGVSFDPSWGPGKLLESLFEDLVEHTITTPTFVCDFPLETSPLVRQHPDNPLLVEKWDLIGFGMELGTGYSELVDPVEERRRLTEQSLLAARGDHDAMQLDEDFLNALEYAMPPTGGLGLGVDRLLMALTGLGIRETILFPLVKPAER